MHTYPIRLEGRLDPGLSRWQWLVKWLLAIPHYLVIGLFTSGLVWSTTELNGSGDEISQIGGGLIGLLVLIAAVVLAFTGRYPQGLFDLVMGLNRWCYRVWGYAALMTDEYPPFRLDSGGSEPATTPPPPPAPTGGDTSPPNPTRAGHDLTSHSPMGRSASSALPPLISHLGRPGTPLPRGRLGQGWSEPDPHAASRRDQPSRDGPHPRRPGPQEIRRAVEGGLWGWQRLHRFQQAMAFPTIEEAADHLGAHRSTLVRQVQRLERDIGAQLYHRAARPYPCGQPDAEPRSSTPSTNPPSAPSSRKCQIGEKPSRPDR